MYYSTTSQLLTPIGNNQLSYHERKHLGSTCTLTVPTLYKWTLDDLVIADHIVFEEVDHKGMLQSCHGIMALLDLKNSPIPTYIMDNHNHAFYFWHLLYNQGVLPFSVSLIHIDQHADMGTPEVLAEINKLSDNTYVANYTNEALNVWNFIVPAQHSWLVGDITQIRSVTKLLEQWHSNLPDSYILDIDIDFWSDHTPSLEEIAIIQHLYKNAIACTIALSPYFMPLEKSIAVTKKLCHLCIW